MEYTRSVEVIIERIAEKMQLAQDNYRNSRNAGDWRYWEGKWSGLIDSYKITIEVLAEVEKEVEK